MKKFSSFINESSAGRSFDRMPVLGILDRTQTEKRPWAKQLHPEFFTSEEKLNPMMEKTMKTMVNRFLAYMGIPRNHVKDILFKGSLAGYNYTPTSDIDLQIILRYNYEKNPLRTQDDPEGKLLQRKYNKLRADYNKEHGLTLGKEKYPVEFFVHTPKSNTKTGSSSRWSLKNNDWVPGYKPIHSANIPEKNTVQKIMKQYYDKIKAAYADEIKQGFTRKAAAEAGLKVLKNLAIVDRNLALHGPNASLRADVESPENLAFKAIKRTNLVAYLEKMAKSSIDESFFNILEELEYIETLDAL